MSLVDLVSQLDGRQFKDGHGGLTRIKLLEPLMPEELEQVRCSLPCSMPLEMEECLRYSRGLKLVREAPGVGKFHDVPLGVIEGAVDWSSLCLDGQYLEEIMPCAISIATDGFGNSWNMDITADSKFWGPIYFVCHDPPVVVYQCEKLEQFLAEAICELEQSGKSNLSRMLKEFAMEVWSKNSGLLTRVQALTCGDETLELFAKELDDSYFICDMRNAELGDGFSWGRFGATAALRRFHSLPIYAYNRPAADERPWWKRILG